MLLLTRFARSAAINNFSISIVRDPDEVLARILNDEITEGTDSGEESDLDRQLENGIEDSR